MVLSSWLSHCESSSGSFDVVAYSEEGPGRAKAPPSPFIAVPNVTAQPTSSSSSSSLSYEDL